MRTASVNDFQRSVHPRMYSYVAYQKIRTIQICTYRYRVYQKIRIHKLLLREEFEK